MTLVINLNAQETKIDEPFDVEIANESLKMHSPHKATMLSAVIPGLGQAYNKKYWKIPIIYGVAGTFIYFFNQNNDEYNRFKNAYYDMENGIIDHYEVYYSSDIIKKIKDNYRRNRDYNIIGLSAVYILNIVDATVDAHLFNYNVNDDLSFRVEPSVIRDYSNKNALGFKCSFKF
ncbi:MAG: DUF5683 domain-containing protein [Bacteroidales bacterium]|nr:DUF5683 domain-containing protein [Bacteroidales bacterium]